MPESPNIAAGHELLSETDELVHSEALNRWLDAHVEDFAGPMHISRFTVGQSNPTYKIETPGAAYVLRRKPLGDLLPSAHAVDREFRVVSALHRAGFPVPRAYALCEDPGVIGSMFYVMSFVTGWIPSGGALPDSTPAIRGKVYASLIGTLAQLHSFAPDRIGLGDYGKPGNYFQRQLDRWSRQYRASETKPIKAMDALIERLPKSVPTGGRVSIVHGDYRLDNLILDPETFAVRAVLDWELSTLGDPLGDLTYLLTNWVAPAWLTPNNAGIGDQDLAALGIPSQDQVVADYCRLAGRDGIDNLDWYLAYNLFRLGGIYQGIVARARAGNASASDALTYEPRVEPLADLALTFAQKVGI